MDSLERHSPERNATRHPLLLGFAWLVAAATLFLVVAGGQVTSTDSGDAVPTWPLPLQLELGGGRVAFELGHRQVAAIVGLLTFALLAGVVVRRRTLPRAACKCAVAAAVLVLVQAGLGGLRVLVGVDQGTDESASVTAFGVAHAVLGQIFFCVVAAVAYWIGRSPPATSAADPALRSATRRAVAFLFLQLVAGALLRLTRPGPVPLLLLVHILGAVLVAFGICDVIFRVLRDPGAASLRAPAKVAAALLAAQFVLGMVAFLAVNQTSAALPEFNWRTVVPTVHQGTGALLLLVSVLMNLSAGAVIRRATPAPPLEPAEVAA